MTQTRPTPRVIFFDIDDTLYLKNRAYLPESIYTAFRQLKARGIQPAIATGRSLAIFPPAVKKLVEDAGVELLITINGQCNFYQGKRFTHYPMPLEQIRACIAQLESLGIAYGFVGTDGIAISERNEAVSNALKNIDEQCQIDRDFAEKHAVYQLLAFYPEAQQAQLDALLPAGLKCVRWHSVAVDILNEANSKAQGIADFLAWQGLDWADCAAFGDGENDIEMITRAGTGIAMEHGAPALHAVADRLCPPIEQDGIFNTLVQLGWCEGV